MTIKARIEALREQMKQHNIQAYIIPSTDAHNSEYVADHWQSRSWISGFDGSAGTVVVTTTDAGLWTDGRYHIQAAEQLEGTGIVLFKAGLPEVPSPAKWLGEQMPESSTVGFDGSVFSVKAVRDMEKEFKKRALKVDGSKDLIAPIWSDRPALPASEAFIHDLKFAGKTTIDKLTDIRTKMAEDNSDWHLITTLDDIAWTLNIRGGDVPCTPIVISFLLIGKESATWFVNSQRVPADVQEKLANDGVALDDYRALTTTLSKLPKSRVIVSPGNISQLVFTSIPAHCHIVEKAHLSTIMKAKKNPTEIEGMKNAHIKDGVAMVRYLKWLEEKLASGVSLNEYEAQVKLNAIRLAGEACKALSFTPISGYAANGAMMHYSAQPDTAAKMEGKNFYLVDSGGNYLDGTTDITRTLAHNAILTPQQKTDFTLVLKGLINLSRTKFMAGTAGIQLDIIARGPLWQQGINYGCGTGHGVGMFLNVHEGPQSIGPRTSSSEPFEPGNVVTIEPGVYREGEYGIRLENIVEVVEDEKNDFGTFYSFQNVTWCPIDTKAIVKDLLGSEETAWLNQYHSDVYDKLSPSLTNDEKAWLKVNTQAI